MTDIVEQAARVIGAGRLILRDNGKRNNEKIAQALADAGLLREPTTDELWDKLMDGEEEPDAPITAAEINRVSGAKFAEPARTVPTRAELVETVSGIDAASWPNPASTEEIAVAIHALMHNQPTVAEVKAQALEEAADAWHAENAGTSPRAYRWLRNRAQEIREEQ